MLPDSLALVNQKIAESIGVFIRDGVQSELKINEIQQPCKNGRVIWVEATTRYAMNDQGEVEIIGVSRNIDERKQKEKEIEYLSTHDFLTKLYNRSYFEREAEREITRVQRYQTPLSLLMLDIDLFKKINDQFGHLAEIKYYKRCRNLYCHYCDRLMFLLDMVEKSLLYYYPKRILAVLQELRRKSVKQ